MSAMTDSRALEVLAAMRKDGGTVAEADYTAAIDHAIARLREPAGVGGDREADRARFSDAAFNDWLDTGISDAGHTVWDAVGDVQAAWAGWEARQFAGDAVLIAECCGREECGGECGNEWRGMGMYRKPEAAPQPHAEAQAEGGGEVWHSMDTAPRDGTGIFALLPDSDFPVSVRYCDGGWHVAWDGERLGEFDQPHKWMRIPDEDERTAPPSAPVGVEEMQCRLDREESDHGRTIDQRDAAEDALGRMFQAVTGRPAEWSSAWGFVDAVEEVEEHVAALAQQPAAVDEEPDCPHSALDGCDCYAAQPQGGA
ncbi:hypothetical protein WCE39_08050 [Luteimonas sp. MJ174]|uniref:hypothetical protein n=1 Tax=Luteimonas sp. MJ174 TaxID=3129237 RepID=UPI0031BAFECE